jgi:O-acetylhomoserine (thiol)-lyase
MNGSTGKRHLETLLVHGDGETSWPREPGVLGQPTLPPIAQSVGFAHESAEDMEAVFAGRAAGHVYSRMHNPTVAALESRITALCGAAGSVAMASGMSAIASTLLAFLRTGDELIAGRFLFGGTYVLLERTLKDLGIRTHFADPRDPGEAESRINDRTRAIFLETIANPAMVVPDFAAFGALAERHHLPLLVDATLLTPVLYDAEAVPADLLFFSGSKFLAGAASVVGGLVVDTGRFPWHANPRVDLGDLRQAGQAALVTKLRRAVMAGIGPCLAPLHAFLLLAGLDSLALRLERQCANAEALAAWLTRQTPVRKVHYPGLANDPQHDLTRRQFRGRAGAVLTFELDDKDACFRFLNALRLIERVTNLGDTRTLAVHPQSTIYGTFWKHEQELLGVNERMVRLSAGIEHVDDLVRDLEQALAAL